MRVLNCTQHDWSNYSHENANALRSMGIWCEDIKENPHWAAYPSQSMVIKTRHEIKERMADADLVQIMHTDARMLDLCHEVGQNNIIVYHTGTKYRKSPKMYRDTFDGVLAVVCDTPDLIGLTDTKDTLISMTVNTELLQPIKKVIRRPYIIAHYPSKAHVKGSDKVERVVRKAHKELNNFMFKMSYERNDYYHNLRRIAACDIYIEMLAPKQDGYNYGAWGTTALEAAALGKIVVTCDRYADIYKEHYGVNTPFIIAHTQTELFIKLKQILKYNSKQISNLQDEHRKFVVKNHSYRATGMKLLKLYKKLCPELLKNS